MNAAFCLLLYGAVLTWQGPPVLNRLTRSGRSPRLSVTVWLTVIGLAVGCGLRRGSLCCANLPQSIPPDG